jgi:2-deoxy-D-gluconate 3-dehydrogenase
MPTNLFSLADKVALVTGGSKGIGRMIAEGFLNAGCRRVYIVGRDAAACAATAESLGPNCVALVQDVSSVAGCQELAQEFARREPVLDILVNNAGTDWIDEFEVFPEEGWDRVMDLNIKGPFFLIQAMRGRLAAAASPGRPSKIINIVSIDALKLNPVEAYSYYASKSGLMFLTRRLAARLIKDGIVINAIAPGAFATDLNYPARDDPEAYGARYPTGRIGTPEDMQGAAIFLAARSGDWILGDTIVVDGGRALANTSG